MYGKDDGGESKLEGITEFQRPSKKTPEEHRKILEKILPSSTFMEMDMAGQEGDSVKPIDEKVE